jgi:hypothetical protein
VRAASIAALALLAAACGYGFSDERAVFGPEIRRIEIRAFENRSTQPGYEQMLVDALAEEFSRRGALAPVYEGSAGDLVLVGRIDSVKVQVRSFSPVALAVEDTVELRVAAEVRRRSDGGVVWKRDDFRLSELFLSSPDPNVELSNREQALRRLSSLLAERIHDELFQVF